MVLRDPYKHYEENRIKNLKELKEYLSRETTSLIHRVEEQFRRLQPSSITECWLLLGNVPNSNAIWPTLFAIRSALIRKRKRYLLFSLCERPQRSSAMPSALMSARIAGRTIRTIRKWQSMMTLRKKTGRIAADQDILAAEILTRKSWISTPGHASKDAGSKAGFWNFLERMLCMEQNTVQDHSFVGREGFRSLSQNHLHYTKITWQILVRVRLCSSRNGDMLYWSWKTLPYAWQNLVITNPGTQMKRTNLNFITE